MDMMVILPQALPEATSNSPTSVATCSARVQKASSEPSDHVDLEKKTKPSTSPIRPYSSDIYCYGDLLHTVQLNSPFNDSKTFVDLKIRDSPRDAWAAFNQMMLDTNNRPSKDDIQEFIDDNFEEGDELEEWTPTDWKDTNVLTSRMADQPIKDWVQGLNKLWVTLGRKVKDDVRDHPELYSLMYVPNGFIIPGGRFKELYYWDTYWIVQGLLLSDMAETAKGVIENLLWLVETVGWIPNGSRVYYEQRSQVPLLIQMVSSYFKKTKDYEFVRRNFDLIKKEFDYWMKYATVQIKKNGKTYKLARYFAPSNGPRPESYKEDIATASVFATDDEKEQVYWDLKSAASSGWDFSTRWFIKDNTNNGNLTDIHTRDIIPVDLNAILYGNARVLQDLSAMLGKRRQAFEYARIADQWRTAVKEILWNDEDGIWYDYDSRNNIPRKYFYASNVVPLWTKCFEPKDTEKVAKQAVNYLQKTGIMDYRGGIPTSLVLSGEQWDFPNCWAPLNIFVIQGLEFTGAKAAREMSKDLAQRWLHANYVGWSQSGAMFEKYDATKVGSNGGGGEYEVQTGFGWTNGVVLELLNQYGSIPGFVEGTVWASTTEFGSPSPVENKSTKQDDA